MCQYKRLSTPFLFQGHEFATGDERMEMRMPVQQFAVGLNRRDHARHDVFAAQQPPDLVADARPGGGELAQ